MESTEYVLDRTGGRFRVLDRKEKYWPDDALGIQLCKVRGDREGLSFWVREEEFADLYKPVPTCSQCGAETSHDPCPECGHSEEVVRAAEAVDPSDQRTPEPWTTNTAARIKAYSSPRTTTYDYHAVSVPNWYRSVVCVNALAGIADPQALVDEAVALARVLAGSTEYPGRSLRERVAARHAIRLVELAKSRKVS